uniref:Uncharacterized protein n=1 Tax=uncultured marine virus TaxID=186617 RepID=S4TEG9_9VIRU|nr:hypothetical protein [uncultured marine virus]
MARKKTSIQKAERTAIFNAPSGVSYIDSAESLSIINRKYLKQSYVYGIESIEFAFAPSPAYDTVSLLVSTAGDTWPVHNGHTKGHALFNEMNQLVLEDNPSVEGKWAGYKVFLDADHRTQHIAVGNLIPANHLQGEWNYSDYVLPQHEVDPATGLPLAADQCQAHLIGGNVGAAPNFISIGLVEAYQESRSTVFADAPNVPAGFGTSFFNLLTDSGSQEPELAGVILLEGDNPPYDLQNYPGSAGNAATPSLTEFAVINAASPNGHITSFVAQCGLIKLETVAYLNGVPVDAPSLTVKVNYMQGSYKGFAAIPMGQ